MSKTANPTSLKLEIGICDKKLYFLILSLYEKKKNVFFSFTLYFPVFYTIFFLNINIGKLLYLQNSYSDQFKTRIHL